MSRCTIVSATDPTNAATSAAAEDTRPEVISTDAQALLDSVGRLRRSLAVGRALIDLYGRKPDHAVGEQRMLAPPEPRDA
jgi:hypothetical protein